MTAFKKLEKVLCFLPAFGALFFLCLVAGCGGGNPSPVIVDDTYAESLEIEPLSPVVPEGGNFPLSAWAVNRKGERFQVSSAHWSVAAGGQGAGSVAQNGVFAGNTKGLVRVKALYAGREALIDVQVSKQFSSVDVFPATPPVLNFIAGDEFTAAVVVTDADADKYRIYPQWTVYNYVGEVDAEGHVRTHSIGRSKLVGAYPYVTAEMRIFFNVNASAPVSIVIVPIQPVVHPFDKVQITVFGLDALANKVQVTPVFELEGNIGSIDANGIWTAGWPEQGTITARVGELEAGIHVRITPSH